MNNKVGYYHKRLDTGEIFYVGIGEPNRPYEDGSRNPHWHHIVDKVGYEVLVIKENITWEDACEWEVSEIKRIGRRDLDLGPLVNLTDGGEGTQGVIMTEERRKNTSEGTKKAMSNPAVIQKMKDAKVDFTPWNKGVTGIFMGENNPNYNNPWSDEQKLEMSEKLKEVYKDGFTDEHINKLKEKRKGRKPSLGMRHSDKQKKMWSEKRKGDKYVNNGTITKRIKQFEIETFLQNGWVYGKLQKNNLETQKKLSERTKNRIWVSKSGKTKMVKQSELQSFLKDGWVSGRIIQN
jgi:hypothetical protein